MEGIIDYLKIAGAGVVTLGAASAYYLLQGPQAMQISVDLSQQSRVFPGTEGARISSFCEHQMLTANLYEGVETLYDAFQRGLKLSGDKPCLGYKPSADKPYQWITYNQVNTRSKAFGAGLINLGLAASNSTRVGIYSQNRPEYIIADQAFYRHSLTGVPLYDTLGEDACSFIINQAELSTIVCDTNAKVEKLLDRHRNYPLLNTLVVMETPSFDSTSLANSLNVQLLHFSDVEKLADKYPVELKPPKSTDLCMICYTSGTTGTPKGAMLTHGNLMAAISGGLKVLLGSGLALSNEDSLISYLPLAHSYERVLEAVALMMGAKIGFFQGDVKKLMDDIKELQPTIFPSVPRLLNRFYDKVISGVNASRVKKFLFNMAIKSKTKELRNGIIRNNSIWDKVVFRTVQSALGGRVRLITTGSAPISGTVLHFLRCIVGCPILEGYGQTEDAAVCTLTMVGDAETGHVGPPLPCNLIKLIDVPEMDYYASKGKGEVCLSGPNVFMGYLKDNEKTAEALDKNGWLHTGDIGEWSPNGSLRIIDRKKNIFKLAQGEYIAPEKIENILVQSPWVAQAYVHGDSLQSCLVAIVVPDPETVPGLAGKQSFSGKIPELIKDTNLKNIILKDLTVLGKESGLSSLEQVKDITLYPELFSVENGLLTPTFKLKRFELAKFFSPQISSMYEHLASFPST